MTGKKEIIRPIAPTPMEIDFDFLENAKLSELTVSEYMEDKKGEMHEVHRIAPGFFSQAYIKRFMPITYAGTTYIWNPYTLTFCVESGEIKSWSQRQIRKLVNDGLLPATTKFDPITREIISQVKGHKTENIDTYPFNMYNGFPVNNGVIVFAADGTYTVEQHSPTMKFTHKCPWDYNPNANTSKAESILKMWLGEDWRWLVQIPAQAVVQSLPGFDPFKQAYMIIGEGDSGKSTYNSAIQCFFGKENVSTKTLQSLNDKFSKGDLVGMFMNFGDDLTTFKVEEGNEFKTIIGIEDQTVEQKFKDSFKAKLTAVHAYSANALPELAKAMYGDIAWWSRWAIIEFTNHFEKIPSWKSEHLDQEFFEGLLLLVIDMAGEIIRNKKLLYTQDWHEVKQKWIGSSSKLHEFIEQSVEVVPNYVIRKQDFLDALDDWALHYMPVPAYLKDEESIMNWRKDQRQRLPETPGMLTKALKMEGIFVKQSSQIPPGEKEREWVYKDVTFLKVPWAKFPTWGDETK